MVGQMERRQVKPVFCRDAVCQMSRVPCESGVFGGVRNRATTPRKPYAVWDHLK